MLKQGNGLTTSTLRGFLGRLHSGNSRSCARPQSPDDVTTWRLRYHGWCSQALADGLSSHQTGWGQTWDIAADIWNVMKFPWKYGLQRCSNCSTSRVCKATASTQQLGIKFSHRSPPIFASHPRSHGAECSVTRIAEYLKPPCYFQSMSPWSTTNHDAAEISWVPNGARKNPRFTNPCSQIWRLIMRLP